MQRTVVIAPTGLRLLAFGLDLLLLLPVDLGLGLLLIHGFDPSNQEMDRLVTFQYMILTMITNAVYYISTVSLFQATPGKMALHLTIVKANGEPLMPDTAILRYLVY